MDEEIVGVFGRRAASALFVTELRAALGSAWDAGGIDAALGRLAASGALVVEAKSVPDPHLADADLRIAAPAGDGARAAIDALWRDWLREFLGSHRCC